MTTTISLSRQNVTGSLARALCLLERVFHPISKDLEGCQKKKPRLLLVFSTYFSVFGNGMKHSSSWLIYHLKPSDNLITRVSPLPVSLSEVGWVEERPWGRGWRSRQSAQSWRIWDPSKLTRTEPKICFLPDVSCDLYFAVTCSRGW